MKRPALSQDLVPVHEFRANMASWLKKLSDDGRTVVLTQRGRAAAVLVDPSVLDEVEESREVVRKVMQGLEDVAAGHTMSREQLEDELEELIASVERGREG